LHRFIPSESFFDIQMMDVESGSAGDYGPRRRKDAKKNQNAETLSAFAVIEVGDVCSDANGPLQPRLDEEIRPGVTPCRLQMRCASQVRRI
jgi:arginine decarboxylase-like protein